MINLKICELKLSAFSLLISDRPVCLLFLNVGVATLVSVFPFSSCFQVCFFV